MTQYFHSLSLSWRWSRGDGMDLTPVWTPICGLLGEGSKPCLWYMYWQQSWYGWVRSGTGLWLHLLPLPPEVPFRWRRATVCWLFLFVEQNSQSGLPIHSFGMWGLDLRVTGSFCSAHIICCCIGNPTQGRMHHTFRYLVNVLGWRTISVKLLDNDSSQNPK